MNYRVATVARGVLLLKKDRDIYISAREGLVRIMSHEHATNYRREGSLPARQTDTQTSNSNDQSGKTEGGKKF